MTLESWIGVTSGVLCVGAALLTAYGASRTQRALDKAHERDRVIDAMAWVDRHLFHGGKAAGSQPR